MTQKETQNCKHKKPAAWKLIMIVTHPVNPTAILVQ